MKVRILKIETKMQRFLIETECANLTDHHLFWCSKCNTNKVDSLEHSTGRFFCISGQEFSQTVGEPKQVVFALCPTCLATDMWDTPEKEVKPTLAFMSVRSTWEQVQESVLFKAAFKKRDLSACINMTAGLMHSSLEDAKDLVIGLLDETNHIDRSVFVQSLKKA